MNETNLSERIIKLEKQVIRINRIAWVMGAVLLLVVTLGAVKAQTGVQDSISTKELKIVDDDGRTRVKLGVELYPFLILLDESGIERARLDLQSGFSQLMLTNDRSSYVARIASSSSSAMLILDKPRGPSGLFCVSDNGQFLNLDYQPGQPRCHLGGNENENNLFLYDNDRNRIFSAP